MAPLLTRRMLLRCAFGAAALHFGAAMGGPASANANANAAGSRIALVIGNGAYLSLIHI